MKIIFENNEVSIKTVPALIDTIDRSFNYYDEIIFFINDFYDEVNTFYDKSNIFEVLYKKEIDSLIKDENYSTLIKLVKRLRSIERNFNDEDLRYSSSVTFKYLIYILFEIESHIKTRKNIDNTFLKLSGELVSYFNEKRLFVNEFSTLLITEILVSIAILTNAQIYLTSEEIDFLVREEFITESITVSIDDLGSYKLDSLLAQVRKFSNNKNREYGYYELSAVTKAINRSRFSKSANNLSRIPLKEFFTYKRNSSRKLKILQDNIEELKGLDNEENAKVSYLIELISKHFVSLERYITRITLYQIIIMLFDEGLDNQTIKEAVKNSELNANYLKYLSECQSLLDDMNSTIQHSALEELRENFITKVIKKESYLKNLSKRGDKLISHFMDVAQINESDNEKDNDDLFASYKNNLEKMNDLTSDYSKEVELQLRMHLKNIK